MIKLSDIYEHIVDGDLAMEISRKFSTNQMVMTTKQINELTHHKSLTAHVIRKLRLKIGADYIVIQKKQAPKYFELYEDKKSPKSAVWLQSGILKVVFESQIKECQEYKEFISDVLMPFSYRLSPVGIIDPRDLNFQIFIKSIYNA